MIMTEKSAVARVLLVSKKAYYMIKDGQDVGNAISLLDDITAMLSHAFDEKKPAVKCMRAFKRGIKTRNKSLYPYVKNYFANVYATPDYNEEFLRKHIPAIVYANDLICAKLVSGQTEKAKSMCGAMASYPGFIFGEYSALSDSQFYELVFGYYKKFYDDEFMDKMKYLFE